MNNLEAKLILQAYRPSGDDASGPFFREALEQVERDPELKKWFANEMAWDANLRSRLETALPVPRNLKANLLALQKMERPIPWWLNLFKLTAATAMMIALMIFISILGAHVCQGLAYLGVLDYVAIDDDNISIWP